ncbi:MAG: SDR family oxidoreductase [Spirochaeta sp.]|nr:SDR family oxidoreductase [Spirochaeta sp.]
MPASFKKVNLSARKKKGRTMEKAAESFQGLQALVLGGSGGIGAEIARYLAAAGADLVIHGGHDEGKLLALRSELDGYRGRLTTVLRELNDVRDSARWAATYENIDILVVAFGPFLFAGLEETSPEDWEKMAMLNLGLPGALVSTFAPRMASTGYGRILLFGGTDTDLPQSFRKIAAYSAAKSGLATLARSAAARFGASGVTVNVLCPGPVETEYQSESETLYYQRILADSKLMKATELVPLAALLLSQAGAAVNGATIRVDKGWDRRP